MDLGGIQTVGGRRTQSARLGHQAKPCNKQLSDSHGCDWRESDSSGTNFLSGVPRIYKQSGCSEYGVVWDERITMARRKSRENIRDDAHVSLLVSLLI